MGLNLKCDGFFLIFFVFYFGSMLRLRLSGNRAADAAIAATAGDRRLPVPAASEALHSSFGNNPNCRAGRLLCLRTAESYAAQKHVYPQ